MKRFILYLAGVTLTAYMAILYKSQILTALLVAEILIPVPVMILSAAAVRMVKVHLSVPVAAVERNCPAKVILTVENRSFLPVVCGTAEIIFWNQFRKTKSSRKISIQAAGRSRTEFSCEWQSGHCGSLIFQLREVRIPDYLHILFFRIRLRESAEISILPVPFHVELPAGDPGRIQEGGEKFDPDRSGDDPSEVFDIREYRAGDRLSGIHWKMTARADDLMVKEYSRPLGGEGILFLDLFRPDADGLWRDADDYMDLLFSLCLAFLEEERRCRAVWKGESEELQSQSIEDEASVYELLGRLFRICPYGTEFPMEDKYREQHPEDRPAFQYRLDLRGRIWEGGQLLWEKERTDPYS